MMFKRFLLSDFLSTMLSSAINIYIYWFAYHSFSDQKMISLIGFSQLGAIFLSTLGGGMSDYFDRVRFIRGMIGLRIAFLFFIWLLIGVFPAQFLLIVFMFLSTVLGSLLSPMLEAIIPLLSKNETELYRFNSLASSLTQVAYGCLLISSVCLFFQF